MAQNGQQGGGGLFSSTITHKIDPKSAMNLSLYMGMAIAGALLLNVIFQSLLLKKK